MTYRQALRYLELFVNYEKVPAWPSRHVLKLERIRGFLQMTGNPHTRLRCVHVAGTKGKGSTCAFISSILREAGYRTGLYTSPHLADFRERIRILLPRGRQLRPGAHEPEFEGMIPRRDFAALIGELEPRIDAFNRRSRWGALTFFEVCTAAALLYFEKEHVDIAVLETGLGGRFDATNVVAAPVCAITPLSLEHTDKLGRTLEKIAYEKAGIIKAAGSNGPPQRVVSAPQAPEARRVIRKRVQKTGAILREVGKEITYRTQGGAFAVNGALRRYPGLVTRLLGEHQVVNASVAIACVEALEEGGIRIGRFAIARGVRRTVWPGRCEVVRRRPTVVLDGAQNAASCRCLAKTVKTAFTYKKLILVLGVSRDKDIRGISRELKGLADELILTRAHTPRATPPGELAGYFRGIPATCTANVSQARSLAMRRARAGDLVLVCGSLFVVGEFRNAAV